MNWLKLYIKLLRKITILFIFPIIVIVIFYEIFTKYDNLTILEIIVMFIRLVVLVFVFTFTFYFAIFKKYYPNKNKFDLFLKTIKSLKDDISSCFEELNDLYPNNIKYINNYINILKGFIEITLFIYFIIWIFMYIIFNINIFNILIVRFFILLWSLIILYYVIIDQIYKVPYIKTYCPFSIKALWVEWSNYMNSGIKSTAPFEQLKTPSENSISDNLPETKDLKKNNLIEASNVEKQKFINKYPNLAKASFKLYHIGRATGLSLLCTTTSCWIWEAHFNRMTPCKFVGGFLEDQYNELKGLPKSEQNLKDDFIELKKDEFSDFKEKNKLEYEEKTKIIKE